MNSSDRPAEVEISTAGLGLPDGMVLRSLLDDREVVVQALVVDRAVVPLL